MSRRTRVALTMAAAIALIASASSIAIAVTSATATPKITACYAKSAGTFNGVKHLKGEVRIIAASGSCYGFETKTAWNITGPKGATGPQGPVGPQGPPGPVVTGEVQTWTTSIQAANNLDVCEGLSVGANANNLSPNIPAGKKVHIVDFTVAGAPTANNTLRLWTGAAGSGGATSGSIVSKTPFVENAYPDKTAVVESHFEASMDCSTPSSYPAMTVTVKYLLY